MPRPQLRLRQPTMPTAPGAAPPLLPSAPSSCGARRSCTARGEMSLPRSSSARWASRCRQLSARSTSPPTSPSITPTTTRRSPVTRLSTSSPREPPSSVARPWGCCWASCRGTSRTTRSHVSPLRTWSSATPSCSSMLPSAPSRRRRSRRSTGMPGSRRAPTSMCV